MPTHKEVRILPYSADQLYGLVAAIDRYPEFLPWCVASRIRKREPTDGGEVVWADLVIGFRMVRERFTSKVTLTRPIDHTDGRIDVEYVDGPLKRLQNHWVFVQLPDGSCEIDFFVEFEFRSRVLQKLIGLLFHEALTRMVAAFERRARDIYGPPANARAAASPAA